MDGIGILDLAWLAVFAWGVAIVGELIYGLAKGD